MKRFVAFSLTLAFLAAPGVAFGQGKFQEKFLENIQKALPEKGPAEPKAKRKVLVFHKTAGFYHSSIPTGLKAFALMGDKTGAYVAVTTDDPAYFAPDKLNAFDAVVMLNTTGDCLRPAFPKGNKEEEAKARELESVYKKSLHDFVLSGKGLMGTHSATDTYRDWKAYNRMMGGAFTSHPWGSGSTVGIKIVEPNHPLNVAFKGLNFKIRDEIYQFRPDTALPAERTYLLTLDPENTKMIGNRKDGLYPISWVATYGKGRTFYCSLGHNDEIFFHPAVLQHYLAGLQYALGDLEVPAIATPVVE